MQWDSSDLDVPLHDFMLMFRLTEPEMRREGGSGRIAGRGRPLGPHEYATVVFRESEIRRWLRAKLPSKVAGKVKRAGGFAALDRWRNEYFNRCKLDVEGDAIILPDGTRVVHPLFRVETEH